ncbi:alpha/beta hydrolase [Ottowia sp.]|uniref:alpha/beta hydrolase n=1 Tax=Ottowia sp. TaxID=1898956 RepID=UPI003A86FFAE
MRAKVLHTGLLLALLLTATLAIAIAITFGGPSTITPLASVNAPFAHVSIDGLPAVQRWSARDGTSLAYRHYPALAATHANPPTRAVLIHGSSASSRSMHTLALALAQKGVVVDALDVRGHGDSGPRGDIAYIGQLEDDLADFMRAHPFSGRNVLLGFSAGGGFALRFAGGLQQALFDRYALLAPYLGYDAPTTRPNNGGWASVGVPRVIALRLLNAVGITAFNPLPVTRFALDDWGQRHLTPHYSYTLSTNFAPHRRWRDDIAQARAPITVLVGQNDELFAPKQFAPAFAGAHPTASVAAVPQVDHMGLILQADAVRAIVQALRQHPG